MRTKEEPAKLMPSPCGPSIHILSISRRRRAELLVDLGCSYRFRGPVTGVLIDENTVTGVVSHGKQGVEEFRVATVVDATGDADTAYFAGAEMVAGRESFGSCLGAWYSPENT